MSAIGSVVMETDGSFSVLPQSQGDPGMLLSDMCQAGAYARGSRQVMHESDQAMMKRLG